MRIKNEWMILAIFAIFCHSSSFAVVFKIAPVEPVPETVPEYGKTYALYTVTNTTPFSLLKNYVKKLPTDVTQVTCDPKYCGSTFDLGPVGSGTESCTMKLTIRGPVDAVPSDFIVCATGGTVCDMATPPLHVVTGESVPFVGIGAGNYSDNHAGIFPLLAFSNDSGHTWSYPEQIFRNLQQEIDPDFSNGVLSAAACSGSADKSVCIAPGEWCSGAFCDNALPLIAVGRQNATSWSYPKSVFENMTSVVDPGFLRGSLRSGSCFGSGGSSVCVAGGSYDKGTAFLPLLARSGDGGKNWTYPPSIFKELQTAIDPNFSSGELFSTSCTETTCDGVCITAGEVCLGNCNDPLPLLAISTDKGNTWTYPSSIFKDLKDKLEPTFQNGYFNSSSCTGSGNEARCIAVGTFSNTSNLLPLLALTQNGGQTWGYPPAVFKNLDVTIGHGFTSAILNAGSCSGSGVKSIFMAAGAYYTRGTSFPVVALSRDGGSTWTYPDFIFTKLKTIVDPEFLGGYFEAASCTGSGKKGICIAAGIYCRRSGLCFPLIAATQNGGKSWSYPASVYQNLTSVIDPNFQQGFFNEASCSGTTEHHFCIASGQFYNGSETLPLVAYSTDGGMNWVYPPAIYQNLNTLIDPDLSIGQFNGGATTGGTFLPARSGNSRPSALMKMPTPGFHRVSGLLSRGVE